MGSYTSLLVLMRPLWFPLVRCVSLWVYMDPCMSLCVLMGPNVYGSLCVLIGPYRS